MRAHEQKLGSSRNLAQKRAVTERKKEVMLMIQLKICEAIKKGTSLQNYSFISPICSKGKQGRALRKHAKIISAENIFKETETTAELRFEVLFSRKSHTPFFRNHR